MRKVPPDVLRAIALHVQKMLSRNSSEALSDRRTTKKYYGFIKTRLKSSALGEFLKPYRLKPADVQVELASVTEDQSDKVHIHKAAYAFTIMIGAKEGLADPRMASYFLRDRWRPVHAGQIIRIPPKTAHGFTVRPGGIVHFISVQAPPIERDDQDDFFIIKERPK